MPISSKEDLIPLNHFIQRCLSISSTTSGFLMFSGSEERGQWHWIFQPISRSFSIIIRKIKINFPHLYSQICCCCDYIILKNNDVLQNRQSFFCRTREIFWAQFLLASLLKQKYDHHSPLSEQKAYYIATGHQSRNLRVLPERCFWCHGNCSISNCEIYFPLSSEIIPTIL